MTELVRSPRREVIKHSSAIQIANTITLLQRRAWNVLLSYAYDQLLAADTHSMRVSELTERLDITSNNDEHLKGMLRGLAEATVEWNVLGKDGSEKWGVAALLADVEVKNGLIEYSYGGILRRRLYNPAVYARIKLSIQNRFGSKHSLALYELLIDHVQIRQTRWITIDEFRRLMGLSGGEYEAFKDLNRYVIRSAVEEINKQSDIEADVTFKREQRRVTALKFRIEKKEQFDEKVTGLLAGARPQSARPQLGRPQSARPPSVKSAPTRPSGAAPMDDDDPFDAYFAALRTADQEALRGRAEVAVDSRGALPPRTRRAMVEAELRRLWKEDPALSQPGQGSG